jgi:hypothetical protein
VAFSFAEGKAWGAKIWYFARACAKILFSAGPAERKTVK